MFGDGVLVVRRFTFETSDVTRPADGERRAVRGFSNQYLVAAELIYESLRHNALEWIRVADPEAGRVDDIQIATPARLDAYQIKWSRFEERISFNDLVSSTGSGPDASPSPMQQLADGWRRLRTMHPGRTARVHFLTRSTASSADRINAPGIQGARHLQAFMAEAYRRRWDWATAAEQASLSGWLPAIGRLKVASGVTDEEFPDFCSAFHLDLGYRLEESDAPDREMTRRRRDVEDIALVLQRLVGATTPIIEMEKGTFLRALGWERRFEFRFKHELPLDALPYRPAQGTVDAIEECLSGHRSGFIALVGAPGSGKSTTLTNTLRYRPGFRTIRYYAFIRDDPHPGRGEAENFLHDVCLALRHLGFPNEGRISSLAPASLEELMATFVSCLGDLHEDWKRTGTVTLIMVDGLDHVERELHPIKSFLEVLPLPTSVPEGVVFVLGTQLVGLDGLPPRVKAHLDEPSRVVTMEALARGAVREIVSSRVPNLILQDGDHEFIYEVSGGHPLTLGYLLNRLTEANNREDVSAMLADANRYGGEIEEDYKVHWEQLAATQDVRDLLALVARFRSDIPLDGLRALCAPTTIERFRRSAAHYFNRETPNRWTFFHNSFRQFLLRKTADDGLGRFDPVQDSAFHLRLAAAAVSAPAGSPLSRDRLFHLERAGDPRAILDCFTQDLFRQQFLAFRPLADISDDIARCLRAAAAVTDPLAVVRALLIEAELSERSDALSTADFHELRIAVADTSEVMNLVLLDGVLQVGDAHALQIAGRLAHDGATGFARRIFDAAEPLDLLTGVCSIRGAADNERLEAWARSAWLFRPLQTILNAVEQVRAYKAEFRNPADGPSDTFDVPEGEEADSRGWDGPAIHLALTLARELAQRGDFARLDALEQEVGARATTDHRHIELQLDSLRVLAAASGGLPRECGEEALARVCASWSADSVEPEVAVDIAWLALCLRSDRSVVKAYIARASAPILIAELHDVSARRGIHELRHLVRQSRVLAALGRPLDPAEAVPIDDDAHDKGTRTLERALVSIATVWGDADRSELTSPEEVVRRLIQPMMLFRHSSGRRMDWHDWYKVESVATEFFSVLLESAAAHGVNALEAVCAAFEADWDAPITRERGSWRPEWQLAIVRKALELGGCRDRAARWTARLNERVDVSEEVHSRLAKHRDAMRSWLMLSRTDEAATVLRQMIDISFGVHHRKDNQFDHWVARAFRFLGPAATLESMELTLGPFFGTAALLYRESRGHGVGDATFRLLKAAAAASPLWGYALSAWFLQHGGASRHVTTNGLLAGIVESRRTPDVTIAALTLAGRQAVPFELGASHDLARACGAAAAACDPSDETGVKAAFATLLAALNTRSASSVRASWLEALRESLEAGEADPFQWGVPTHASSTSLGERSVVASFKLKDGSCVNEATALARAATPRGAELFLAQVSEADRADWDVLLPKLLTTVPDAATLRRIRADLTARGFPPRAEAAFARRSKEIGDIDDACRAVERLLSTSDPNGWSRHWDGGTRLVAARCLIDIDGPNARQRVVKLFVDDYLSTARFAGDRIRSIEEMLDILFEKVPEEPLWNEFREHFMQLAEFREAPSQALPTATKPSANDGITAAVAMAFDDLASPAAELADEARKAILEMVALGCGVEQVTDTIRRLLAGTDEEQTRALCLLECSLDRVSDWAASLAQDCASLYHSASVINRRLAQRIMSALEQEIPPTPSARPLPPIYQLTLPPSPMPHMSLFESTSRSQSDPLPDTEDPVEIVRMLRGNLESVAAQSGFSVEILTRRTVQIMHEIAAVETWNKKAERELQRRMVSADFKISYRRPRPAVAFRAFSHIVGELVDAGYLEWPTSEFEDLFSIADPLLATTDPAVRPPWISLPSDAEFAAYPAEKWLERPEESIPALAKRTLDGAVVMGELSSIYKMDHHTPTETRSSVIAQPTWPGELADDPDRLFLGRPRYRASDYPMLNDFTSLPLSVVHGGGMRTPEFLALSPALGLHLHWQPTTDGLFKWVDTGGEVMAESVRWQEGNSVLREFRGQDSLSAKGWAVIAHPKALAAIAEAMPGARRFTVVRRVLDDNTNHEESRFAKNTEFGWGEITGSAT